MRCSVVEATPGLVESAPEDVKSPLDSTDVVESATLNPAGLAESEEIKPLVGLSVLETTAFDSTEMASDAEESHPFLDPTELGSSPSMLVESAREEAQPLLNPAESVSLTVTPSGLALSPEELQPLFSSSVRPLKPPPQGSTLYRYVEITCEAFICAFGMMRPLFNRFLGRHLNREKGIYILCSR